MKHTNMNRNIKLLILAVLSGIVVIVACNKKLDVVNENSPTVDSYFKTASELQNGVNAIYSLYVPLSLLVANGFLPTICGVQKPGQAAPNWKRQELNC